MTAGRPNGAPNNTFKSIRFGSINNGTIAVSDNGPATSNTTVTIAAGTQQAVFVARRAVSGSITTVPSVLADDSGTWQTFVGGVR